MASKKNVRFNIVDFLIIALLLLSLIAIFLRPAVISHIGKLTANDTVIVGFCADEVTQTQLGQMKEGDILNCDGSEFGELISYFETSAQTMKLITPDVQGEQSFFEKVTLPGLFSVKGQLRLTGSMREDGFYVGENRYVGVGSVLYLEADSYVLTVQITSIS